MRIFKFLAPPLLAATLLLPAGAAVHAADDALTESQKRAVEGVLRDYLMNNPELIVEALQAMEARQEEVQKAHRRAAVEALGDMLTGNPDSPVIGNPDGDVTVVEFSDYNCGYCKQVLPEALAVLKADGNIRYVLKELPVLGRSSVTAARAALAVWSLDPAKYLDVHAALMGLRGGLDDQRVMKTLGDLGLDADEVEAAMRSEVVDRELSRNRQMAEMLGIRGTPAFLIGGELVPGAVGRDRLEALVAAAREARG